MPSWAAPGAEIARLDAKAASTSTALRACGTRRQHEASWAVNQGTVTASPESRSVTMALTPVRT